MEHRRRMLCSLKRFENSACDERWKLWAREMMKNIRKDLEMDFVCWFCGKESGYRSLHYSGVTDAAICNLCVNELVREVNENNNSVKGESDE